MYSVRCWSSCYRIPLNTLQWRIRIYLFPVFRLTSQDTAEISYTQQRIRITPFDDQCQTIRGQFNLTGKELAADESFEPIIQEEIDVFESLYPLAGIVPRYTTEVEAINLLLKDSVRLAIATRTLTEEEMNSFHSRNRYHPRRIRIRRSIRFGTASTQHCQQNDSYQPKLSLHHLTVI